MPSDKKTRWGDTIVATLKARGLYLTHGSRGRHDVRCPWEAEDHIDEFGDPVAYRTYYLEPNYDGRRTAQFVCNCGACKRRTLTDVLELLSPPRWVYVCRLKLFWDARDGELVDRDVYDCTHTGKGAWQRFLASDECWKVDDAESIRGAPRFIERGKLVVLNTHIEGVHGDDE